MMVSRRCDVSEAGYGLLTLLKICGCLD